MIVFLVYLLSVVGCVLVAKYRRINEQLYFCFIPGFNTVVLIYELLTIAYEKITNWILE